MVSMFRWGYEVGALQEANNVDYGLVASVWLAILLGRFGLRMRSRQCISGSVAVVKSFKGARFVDSKDSGVGRDPFLGEVLSYSSLKNVNVASDMKTDSAGEHSSDSDAGRK